MNKLFVLLLIVTENLKFHQSILSKIKYVRYVPFLWYKVISVCQNCIIKHIKVEGLALNTNPRKEKVVVSLTTFPNRIGIIHHTIKTLFLQTYKPDRIILWLADSQFPDRLLPRELETLLDQGLEVRYCKDYRSHKKYFAALQEQKEDEIIITFDDDIIYDLHSIENVVRQHSVYPECIVVNMCHYLRYDKNGKILPYNKWHSTDKESCTPNNYNTPLTGSGCLYPYKALRIEAFDWELIRELAMNTDDLWIYMQVLLSGRQIVSIPRQVNTFTCIGSSQNIKLADINCINNGNDKVIKNLISRFPTFEELIKVSI